ncbi:hypothetical protein N7541_010316 [Penicillium brevicompactum]|uniref:Uncharacterized protein n=1 Tax=Penicillium brevicompactum TaxID=5074 RepID=A0A9W9QNB3_PENBR|nr:hypothetical protein N7541_010316 [Penicillium brevicompactum]
MYDIIQLSGVIDHNKLSISPKTRTLQQQWKLWTGQQLQLTELNRTDRVLESSSPKTGALKQIVFSMKKPDWRNGSACDF